MQIVIDITEKDYEKIRETSFVENIEIVFKQSSEDRKSTMMLFRVIDAIKNGTLLPKGHGDLIDVDSLDIPVDICDGFEAMDYIDATVAIIEADKEAEK